MAIVQLHHVLLITNIKFVGLVPYTYAYTITNMLKPFQDDHIVCVVVFSMGDFRECMLGDLVECARSGRIRMCLPYAFRFWFGFVA